MVPRIAGSPSGGLPSGSAETCPRVSPTGGKQQTRGGSQQSCSRGRTPRDGGWSAPRSGGVLGEGDERGVHGENSRKFELWSYRRECCRGCCPGMELSSCRAWKPWHEGFPLIPGVTRARLPGSRLDISPPWPVLAFAPCTGRRNKSTAPTTFIFSQCLLPIWNLQSVEYGGRSHFSFYLPGLNAVGNNWDTAAKQCVWQMITVQFNFSKTV